MWIKKNDWACLLWISGVMWHSSNDLTCIVQTLKKPIFTQAITGLKQSVYGHCLQSHNNTNHNSTKYALHVLVSFPLQSKSVWFGNVFSTLTPMTHFLGCQILSFGTSCRLLIHEVWSWLNNSLQYVYASNSGPLISQTDWSVGFRNNRNAPWCWCFSDTWWAAYTGLNSELALTFHQAFWMRDGKCWTTAGFFRRFWLWTTNVQPR